MLCRAGLRSGTVPCPGGASGGNETCLAAGDAAADGFAFPGESAGLPSYIAAPGKTLFGTETCAAKVLHLMCASLMMRISGKCLFQDLLPPGADGIDATRLMAALRGHPWPQSRESGEVVLLVEGSAQAEPKKRGGLFPPPSVGCWVETLSLKSRHSTDWQASVTSTRYLCGHAGFQIVA